MSRIGKQPVAVPAGVTVSFKDGVLTVVGKLGTLVQKLPEHVSVKSEGASAVVTLDNPADENLGKFWGLSRSLLANMVLGVTEGYKKSLQIEGVGYKFESVTPAKVVMAVGFSHRVEVAVPKGIKIEVDAKEKSIVHVSGADKQLVGQFAAHIHSVKEPEPYKGKGIHYVGETIRRKAGKTAAK